ncbi:tripartite tricarboxylate transporter substrate-binding protein [Paracraurococcus lichenis]|uniref:Tripartite tricarboxylate transporter substrate-binding protein n=1 Tax=Paracraurococcus lichenis TaxID=3064888 RepID=A0ABT9DS61_9PROT|nr:tripartite tricarboxylate transporter substrate-binding protein [Paracraurococcus sp. LOR1-02]MDO9706741.1 tripartite tricarboxylate transporter substrate-binding protein [Paracraurococcus sp. LOR1-02]
MTGAPRAGPGRRALGAAALGLLRPGLAAAQPGPVTLLVGAPPGSGADSWARGFAPFLERHWPRAMVAVVNRPGEGGLAAARSIAAAPADARLIGAVGTPLLLARAVAARAEALLDRLAFVAAVAEEPLVLVGLAGTTDDLDALRALGPQAVLGTPPHGSAAQLAGIALGRALPMGLLSFPNAAAARQAVLAGNIAAALLAVPDAIAALRDGRLAGLALAQEQRSDLLPEVPTFLEQGIPLRLAAHRGFAVPAGTEAAPLQPLLQALRAVVADPEFAAQAQAQGYIPRFIGPTAWEPMLRRRLAELSERWATDPWTSRQE